MMVVAAKTPVRRTKTVRLSRGLSSYAVAAAIGTTAPTVIRHDNGTRTMRRAKLKRYARLLGLTLDEALAFEDAGGGENRG